MTNQETPRGLFNMATHLPVGEAISYDCKKYGRKISFRNSLMELVKRREASECFKVSSSKNIVTITKLSNYLSYECHQHSPTSGYSSEAEAMADYESRQRARILHVALEDFAAGTLDEETFKAIICNYTEEEITQEKEKINAKD